MEYVDTTRADSCDRQLHLELSCSSSGHLQNVMLNIQAPAPLCISNSDNWLLVESVARERKMPHFATVHTTTESCKAAPPPLPFSNAATVVGLYGFDSEEQKGCTQTEVHMPINMFAKVGFHACYDIDMTDIPAAGWWYSGGGIVVAQVLLFSTITTTDSIGKTLVMNLSLSGCTTHKGGIQPGDTGN